jgi:hypothetical protein
MFVLFFEIFVILPWQKSNFISTIIKQIMKRPLRLLCLFIFLLPLISTGQQLENPGFEEWEIAAPSINEPVEWSTIKTADSDISALAPVTFDRSDDAHSGLYSLKLYNVTPFPNLVATGAITNGRFHAEFDLTKSYSYSQRSDPKYHTVFTGRPDSLTGWFKYFPNLTDAAQFKVVLHVDSCTLPAHETLPNWVGMAVYKTENGVTYDTWTRFSVPFTYFSDDTPEYLLTTLNSGDSITAIDGSYLLVDDLQLVYGPEGITEHDAPIPFLSVAAGRLMIDLPEKEYLNNWLYLIDASGKTLLAQQLKNSTVMLPGTLSGGIYVAVMDGSDRQYVQKVMIP